ncbi:MAG: SH3 domain-containing protein, partial [Chloroflexota bacterium]
MKLYHIAGMILLIGAVLTASMATAQTPVITTTPSFLPQIIPPQDQSPVDEILNDPAVLTPRPTATFPNIPAPGRPITVGMTAIVIADKLNLRAAPSAGNTPIIEQLDIRETVTVLRVTADGRWAFVDTTGADFLQGWVSTDFIREAEDFEFFEATSAPLPTEQAPTGLVLRADENVNIRSAPVIFSARVGLLPVGA